MSYVDRENEFTVQIDKAAVIEDVANGWIDIEIAIVGNGESGAEIGGKSVSAGGSGEAGGQSLELRVGDVGGVINGSVTERSLTGS